MTRFWVRARVSTKIFSGKVRRPIRITVADTPSGDNKRELTVTPLGGDSALHRDQWFRENQEKVDELSRGRIGYIYIPLYLEDSIEAFMRQYAVAATKEAILIDQRYNFGGITSDVLVQMLTRTPYHHYAFPYGQALTVPIHTMPGPKAVLVNQFNFSAGETFPLMFKLANAGMLIGKRTGGGGTGVGLDQPLLIDGGRLRIPNRAAFNPETGWFVENTGVTVDLEVDWWPEDWKAGKDPQLETAVQTLLEQLEKAPAQQKLKPKPPVHSSDFD